MNEGICVQAEDNSFQPILPEEDIAQIYQRILDTEIEVAGGSQAQGSGGPDSKASSSAQNLKLAAAMGLTQLMLPFRCIHGLLPIGIRYHLQLPLVWCLFRIASYPLPFVLCQHFIAYSAFCVIH